MAAFALSLHTVWASAQSARGVGGGPACSTRLHLRACWHQTRPLRPRLQTAGYLMSYQGLKFASVHDAGHHVAYFKPAHALQMIAAFLDGRLP